MVWIIQPSAAPSGSTVMGAKADAGRPAGLFAVRTATPTREAVAAGRPPQRRRSARSSFRNRSVHRNRSVNRDRQDDPAIESGGREVHFGAAAERGERSFDEPRPKSAARRRFDG